MEYRTLGKTGLKISRMGFGGIPIQKIDEEGTKKLLHDNGRKREIQHILIPREDTQSVNGISVMGWREFVINLYLRQNPWQNKRSNGGRY